MPGANLAPGLGQHNCGSVAADSAAAVVQEHHGGDLTAWMRGDPMPDQSTPDRPAPDIDRLRAAHPLWTITATWTTAPSGPDHRRLAAVREGIRLTAWTVPELEAQIAEREAAHGWG